MGAPKEPEREAWRSMNRRPVPVCDQWRQSYAAFKDDVGPKPHPKHVLSRRDKSAPYQPGNVAWAPKWADNLKRPHRTVPDRYIGVSNRGRAGFVARITSGGKTHHLGYFPTAELAAEAYNQAARQYHGPDAKLNSV